MKKYLVISILIIAEVAAILLTLLVDPIITVAVACGLIIGDFIFGFIYMEKCIAVQKNKASKYKRELKELNFEIQAASTKILSISENLNQSLEENNQFSQKVYDKTIDMKRMNDSAAEGMKGAVDSVRSLIEMLENSRGTTQKMQDISINANGVISSSLTQIYGIVKIIKDIQQSSNDIKNYIEQLTYTSNQIVNILETVNSISKQTNMLALNAAIESAKINSDNGRGFAIIASQIRSLSEDTAEAVKNISDLLALVDKNITGVNTVAEHNWKSVNEGVETSDRIEKNLLNIDNSFKQVLDIIQTISKFSTEQVAVTNEVGSGIENIDKLLASSTNSVSEVSDYIYKQKHLIEEISLMGGMLKDSSSVLLKYVPEDDDEKLVVDEKRVDAAMELFNSLCRKLFQEKSFISMNPEEHRKLLEIELKNNDIIEAIWTNDAKGKFICSIPEAGIINASVREWYKKAMEGKLYISEAYVSAITKRPCMTISTAIKDGDRLIGVIGIDIKL